MNLEDLERTLCARLDASGAAPRTVLLKFLTLPDHERARRIGEWYGDPRTQTFAQLLIDLEESPHARAVVLGELRERQLRRRDLDDYGPKRIAAPSPKGRRNKLPCGDKRQRRLGRDRGCSTYASHSMCS